MCSVKWSGDGPSPSVWRAQGYPVASNTTSLSGDGGMAYMGYPGFFLYRYESCTVVVANIWTMRLAVHACIGRMPPSWHTSLSPRGRISGIPTPGLVPQRFGSTQAQARTSGRCVPLIGVVCSLEFDRNLPGFSHKHTHRCRSRRSMLLVVRVSLVGASTTQPSSSWSQLLERRVEVCACLPVSCLQNEMVAVPGVRV